MKIIKEFRKSVKFICNKCGYPVTAKKGSICAISCKCSPCIEGLRLRKMDWSKWTKGMKAKAESKTR